MSAQREYSVREHVILSTSPVAHAPRADPGFRSGAATPHKGGVQQRKFEVFCACGFDMCKRQVPQGGGADDIFFWSPWRPVPLGPWIRFCSKCVTRCVSGGVRARCVILVT